MFLALDWSYKLPESASGLFYSTSHSSGAFFFSLAVCLTPVHSDEEIEIRQIEFSFHIWPFYSVQANPNQLLGEALMLHTQQILNEILF